MPHAPAEEVALAAAVLLVSNPLPRDRAVAELLNALAETWDQHPGYVRDHALAIARTVPIAWPASCRPDTRAATTHPRKEPHVPLPETPHISDDSPCIPACLNGHTHEPPCERAQHPAELERDGAYRERAQLLAWLAALYPAVLAPAADVDEPGWQILYLTPAGHQLSWHISPRDTELFAHVPRVDANDPRAQWDGHTTAEKYDRIRNLTLTEIIGGIGATLVQHDAGLPAAPVALEGNSQ